MKDKKTKTWLIILFISLAILVLMGLISSAIEIGERLRNIHYFVEIAFYTLIAIVVIVGIVIPMAKVFANPVFSLDQLHDINGNVKYKWCKKLVNNLVENTKLTSKEQIEVKGFLEEGNSADDRLIEFFDRKITPEIYKEIFKTARRVFIVTAVSQNSVFDMLGVASLNFMLIRNITELCGFRPNSFQLLRLYIRVMSMTILAGALEAVNVESLISKVVEGFTKAPFVSFVSVPAASLIQGATNAFLTVKVGIMIKNCLLNADVSKIRSEVRKEAFKEAFDVFPRIIENLDEKAKKPAEKIKSLVDKAKEKVAGKTTKVSGT